MSDKVGDIVKIGEKRYEVKQCQSWSCTDCAFGKRGGCKHPASGNVGCMFSSIKFKLIKENEMNKDELRSGDEVVCRNGKKYIVEIDPYRQLRGEVGYLDLGNMTATLESNNNNNFDIVEINRYMLNYGFDRETIYTRPTEDKITITVEINGKKVNLNDISEETLLAIRKLDKEN